MYLALVILLLPLSFLLSHSSLTKDFLNSKNLSTTTSTGTGTILLPCLISTFTSSSKSSAFLIASSLLIVRSDFLIPPLVFSTGSSFVVLMEVSFVSDVVCRWQHYYYWESHEKVVLHRKQMTFH